MIIQKPTVITMLQAAHETPVVVEGATLFIPYIEENGSNLLFNIKYIGKSNYY